MLSQKIEEDIIVAMKGKDSIKVQTLRMLKAALGNFLIEKRKDAAEDAEMITLIQKQVKMRQESMDTYKKAGREELASKEAQEKAILEAYLPKRLTDEELTALIKAAIEQLGAKAPADMGKVMKEVLPKVQGRADGSKVSQMVNSLLKKS